MEQIVFAPYNHCFGDCWAVLNYAIHHAVTSKKNVYLSKYVCAGTHMALGVPPRGEDVGKLLVEQYHAIQIPEGAILKLTNKPVTVIRKITVEEFPYPYYPTKVQWTPKYHGRICIQLDNSQVPEQCARSFKYHDRKAILEWLSDKNYIILGKPHSVAQCAEIASKSDLFIGMDSGMSHLAHSVGLPTLLLDWVALDRFHPKKSFYRFQNAKEAISIAEGLIKQAKEASEQGP
jgi:hypothetical protein